MNSEYQSPFSSRYASNEMKYIFSPDKKFRTWRRLWVCLAEAEKQLGLPVTDAQLDELRRFQDAIDDDVYKSVREKEREVRHDVMAHIHAYCEQCPQAAKIIHLGATSCYVGDNTDIIIMDEALRLIINKIVSVIRNLSDFADKYKDMPTLGFTHFQPAQLTTVGKRACLWINELLMDLKDAEYLLEGSRLLGSKGTTGTQASFLELFDGDEEKVLKLDSIIAEKLGYGGAVPVSGQTYSRKIDSRILAVLSGIAQSASKFASDIRILQHLKEIEEPFEKMQIGSSAMAYKRNPMRSERICALSRFVISNSVNPAFTAANQWLERTLDDSANKRIAVPEAFLAVDSILNLYINISSGLVVYPKVIQKHIMDELPFMATENILMDAVKRGGNRQTLHEKIRLHSIEAAKVVKEQGKSNDLAERIAADDSFGLSEGDIESILRPEAFTGCSRTQTERFISDCAAPVLEKYKAAAGTIAEITV